MRQFCSVTGTVILIITVCNHSAIAEDCSATSSQLVTSAASVSQFSLALGSGAFGSEPCSTHAPREAQAAQQLLIYDNQSPTEVIGSSETAVFYTRRSPTISAGAHRSRTPHGELIVAAAREHDIDPALLQAIISIESADNPNARSPVGARGLMQVMPATGRRFGVADEMRLHEPETNIRAASRYLKTLQGLFGNDLRLVLAAYNAGEGAVQRYGRNIPPYRETQDYVRKVMARYDQLLTARRSSFR